MIAALIQARMGSVRLPGKVLADINGRPMLAGMFDRVRSARKIDRCIAVTSTDPSDDPIVEMCGREGIDVYRGSLDDVLDRYYKAAAGINSDVIVRLTGDCPLMDPRVIDEVVGVYEQGGYDYVANSAPPPGTFPDGMDVEVLSFMALEKAWREAKKPSEREHVTFYFWQNPDKFRIFRHDRKDDLSKLRLTVDHPQDLEVVREIYARLYPKDPFFSMESILDLLNEHPELCRSNQSIQRNHGWASAFAKDKSIKKPNQ